MPPVNSCVGACVCVSLTMITSRIFWKSFLKPRVELQKRAKFPSRSCRAKYKSTLSHVLEGTSGAKHAACQVSTGREHKPGDTLSIKDKNLKKKNLLNLAIKRKKSLKLCTN